MAARGSREAFRIGKINIYVSRSTKRWAGRMSICRRTRSPGRESTWKEPALSRTQAVEIAGLVLVTAPSRPSTTSATTLQTALTI